ncbi:SDR family NAD(P)-dependent oxidoreductase [Emcibacter nanhaiensis]|uniref:Glucose 1-dehydrogenase n=1 Tax=Emcibacter nanhaiensis TaxID=1505037 RepID=A0A501PIB2_9PROT|nr:glucose 1-dehydrogenase [Emcibacter nanhaiensis]TPD60210.1 glucose 1-dehydrogenase [Emcibacter nanhaiensis]
MGRLQGKIALVTGAGQGIGEGIALAMAKEGALVYVADKNGATAARAVQKIIDASGAAEAITLDVAEESEWVVLSDKIAKDHGRLDVLVHNAGVELVGPIDEITLEGWRWVQSVNVDGPFMGSKAMLNLLRESGGRNSKGASIINISSIAGIIAFANQMAYNTSKGAVRQMTKSLAIEFAEAGFNIRVNSIHPGFIRTPMLQDVFDTWAAKGIRGNDPKVIEQEFIDMQPIGRLGEPEDIAMGAVYLASDEAGFVTGLELVIDGGWVSR